MTSPIEQLATAQTVRAAQIDALNSALIAQASNGVIDAANERLRQTAAQVKAIVGTQRDETTAILADLITSIGAVDFGLAVLLHVPASEIAALPAPEVPTARAANPPAPHGWDSVGVDCPDADGPVKASNGHCKPPVDAQATNGQSAPLDAPQSTPDASPGKPGAKRRRK